MSHPFSVPYSHGSGLHRQVRLRCLPYPWLRLTLFRSIDERTLVYFADNPKHIIDAYIESGEGIDRAGGFAIQVRFFLPLEIYPNSLIDYYRALVEFWCEKSRVIIIML